MIKKPFMLIFMPLILCASASQASSFVYRAYFPTSQSCSTAAASTVTEFKSQTKATVVSTKCISTTIGDAGQTKTSALFIEYSSDFEIFPNSFVIGGEADIPNSTALGSGNSEAYSTLQGCEADISKQVATLQATTGLKPVVAYCRSTGESLSGFAMHLDSFQKSSSAIFVLNAFAGTPEPSDLAIAARLVSSTGAVITHTHKNKIYFYDQLSPYNSPARANLKSETAVISAKDSDCMAQKAVVVAAFAKYGSNSLVACTKRNPNDSVAAGYSGSAVEILGLDIDRWAFNQASSTGYQTMSECKQDLARVINNAKSSSQSVVDGVCGFTGDPFSGNYNVILIYHRKI